MGEALVFSIDFSPPQLDVHRFFDSPASCSAPSLVVLRPFSSALPHRNESGDCLVINDIVSDAIYFFDAEIGANLCLALPSRFGVVRKNVLRSPNIPPGEDPISRCWPPLRS